MGSESSGRRAGLKSVEQNFCNLGNGSEWEEIPAICIYRRESVTDRMTVPNGMDTGRNTGDNSRGINRGLGARLIHLKRTWTMDRCQSEKRRQNSDHTADRKKMVRRTKGTTLWDRQDSRTYAGDRPKRAGE